MSDEILYVEDEDGDPMVWTDTPDVAPNPDRTVESFLQSMSPFSAAGPFQIIESGGTEIRTVKCRELEEFECHRPEVCDERGCERTKFSEKRVSLIYEEWTE